MKKLSGCSWFRFLFISFFLSPIICNGSVVDSLSAKLKQAPGDTTRLVLLNNLAAAYMQTNVDTSLLLSKEAWQLGENLIRRLPKMYLPGNRQIKKQLIIAYQQTATIYHDQGNFTGMMEFFLKSLAEAEEIHDSANQAFCLLAISWAYHSEHDPRTALGFARRGLLAYTGLNDTNGIAKSYNIIGAIYTDMKATDSAFYYLKKSLSIRTESNDMNGMAKACNNIGVSYGLINMPDSALVYYLLALRYINESPDKYALSMIYKGIGDSYIALGEYNKAIHNIDSSLALSNELRSLSLIKQNNFSLAGLYAKQGNYKKAYAYYQDFYAINDTIWSTDNQKLISDLQNKYEKEKKDKEINVLNEKNKIKDAEIKRQMQLKLILLIVFVVFALLSLIIFRLYQKRKDAFLKQKDALFSKQVSEVEMKALRAQMNPHFIFNSLRSINEYILLHQTTLASEYLVKFSKLMRAILENSRKKEIFLSDEMEVLELYMQLESQRMEYPFSYSIDIDSGIDPGNIMIPPMLLQPIIENSIWHGLAPKNQPGKISIRIKKQQDTIQCEIEDNGIGREVSRGVNENNAMKAQSYGLKITAERLAIIEQTKKIKTHLTFQDLNGSENVSGLNVTFTLPVEEAV